MPSSLSHEDYNAYMRVYILKRYHDRRAAAIVSLGGVCVECGATEELEIDHIDPATKTMSISKMWSVSKARYEAELELCQLLCKPHHIEKTSRENSVEHGGGVSGKKNCPCEPCRAKNREYHQKRRAALV